MDELQAQSASDVDSDAEGVQAAQVPENCILLSVVLIA